MGIVEGRCDLLQVYLDDGILVKLRSTEKVRPNVKNIEQLRRLRLSVYSPIDKNMLKQLGSFAPAYGLITSILIKMGQINILHTIRGIFNIIIKSRARHNISEDHGDDFIRQKLKHLNSWALEHVSTNPGYMFLMHLHQLGAKSPYTEQQIVDDIENWVSDVKGRINDNKEYILAKLEKYMIGWPHTDMSTLMLDFYSFCFDIQRWATSGGAPRTEYDGEKYRTKWMWGYISGGYSNLENITPEICIERGKEIYSRALSLGNMCNVALKEEASKTREIITTPMASYLRQSYLLYRWGKPRHLQSPIASGNWLAKFNSTKYSIYGAIDGDRFDHTVPKWFILKVIDHLGNIDESTRRIADEEIESMNNLQISWNKRIYKWEGGLLSGWRITSIIGTLLSLIAGDYICEKLDIAGGVHVAAMGDDLIMYSNTHKLDKEAITALYNDFGLKANVNKTNVGQVGDFLRRLYAPTGVYGYPWLGIKSLIYANPWIDKYTHDLETELVNGWWTALSRTLQWSVNYTTYSEWFISVIIKEVELWFPKLQQVKRLISTPISAGGLGVLQSVHDQHWVELNHKLTDRSTDFLAIFGIIKEKLYKKKTAEINKINPYSIYKIINKLKLSEIKPVVFFRIPDNVCIFPTLYIWYTKNKTPSWLSSHLRILLPYSLRTNKIELLKYIVGQLSGSVSLSSIICPKENLSSMTDTMNRTLQSVAVSKHKIKGKELKAATTLSLLDLIKDVPIVNGTW